MQDIRDKLLKAGLVDKKRARQVKTEQRKKRKRRGGERAQQIDEQQRQAAFTERQAAQAEAARASQDKRNELARIRQREDRLRQIVERNAMRKIGGDQRAFYFFGPDRRARRLMTSFQIGQQLSEGKALIVSAPYDDRRDFRLVDHETGERLEDLAPDAILFWSKPGQAGDLPLYGADGPRQPQAVAKELTPDPPGRS